VASVTRRIVVAAVSGVVVLAALGVAAVLTFEAGSRSADYARRMPFDADRWRVRALDDDPEWPARLRMVDSLLASRRLHGMSRADVEQLLGPADQTNKWQHWDAVYWLGPQRGGVRIDSEWLVLRFGEDGRTSMVRVVSD
jgi:hypothetical protein